MRDDFLSVRTYAADVSQLMLTSLDANKSPTTPG
jgi:hypothetical protein